MQSQENNERDQVLKILQNANENGKKLFCLRVIECIHFQRELVICSKCKNIYCHNHWIQSVWKVSGHYVGCDHGEGHEGINFNQCQDCGLYHIMINADNTKHLNCQKKAQQIQ